MVAAYPLDWPQGWPRTLPSERESDSRFSGRTHGLTIARSRDLLLLELERLQVDDIVISSNVTLHGGRPLDPGVAVYFRRKDRRLVMAQDRFITVAGNLRSLGLAVEAMRQLERHGGGTFMERAFTGFVAIAPPSWKKPWREVFGVGPNWHEAEFGDLALLFRAKAKQLHPDNGGSDTLMAELNVAYREALEELRNG